jgi:hypothetical protein
MLFPLVLQSRFFGWPSTRNIGAGWSETRERNSHTLPADFGGSYPKQAQSAEKGFRGSRKRRHPIYFQPAKFECYPHASSPFKTLFFLLKILLKPFRSCLFILYQ